MKHVTTLLFAVLALVSFATHASPRREHASVHRLTSTWMEDGKHWGGVCSSVAVGPHLLLTALHCTEHYYDGELQIDGKPAKLVKMWVTSTEDDQALVRVNRTFKTWAKMATHAPEQGDHVHWWGQPDFLQDVYREGYVTSVLDDGTLMLDANGWYGDSGSGIFNEQGEVVATMNRFRDLNFNFKLMYAFQPVFPAVVWKDALG